jgi:hypothetical protein
VAYFKAQWREKEIENEHANNDSFVPSSFQFNSLAIRKTLEKARKKNFCVFFFSRIVQE